MTETIPAISEIKTILSENALGVRTPLDENEGQVSKDPRIDAGNATMISPPNFSWKTARATKVIGSMALDHSLAFHRLQEARQELHRARSGYPALSPREHARLVACCEANLARAEQWVVRTTGPR